MASVTSPEALYRAYQQCGSVSIDSRKIQSGGMFFALAGDRTDGNQYAASALRAGAAYCVVDNADVVPAGDNRYLLVDDALPALQELATRHRDHFDLPVLAITGSNGKTTTKELVAAVTARKYRVHATPGNYNNHIGLPLTILSMPKDTEFLILEMGANHRGEIAALCRIGKPTHGLITNIGEAHLEGFGGIEGVRIGKGELYDWLREHGGLAFVNRDEATLLEMSERLPRKVMYQDSTAPSREVTGMEIRTLTLHPYIEVGFLSGHGLPLTTTLQLAGKHNLQNVKAAVGIGKYFKVPGKDIAAALADYQPSNHRSQELTHRGVQFLWDAYNANPSSVTAALEAFAATQPAARATVVLGEMLELGEDSPAAHRRVVLRAGQVAGQVVLVGRVMRAAAAEFGWPWFADVAALKEWFWNQRWENRRVFVKGSRGNRLERLLE